LVDSVVGVVVRLESAGLGTCLARVRSLHEKIVSE
jgi:hypothetical protein